MDIGVDIVTHEEPHTERQHEEGRPRGESHPRCQPRETMLTTGR